MSDRRPWWLLPAVGGWLIAGCTGEPSAPAMPAWADVEPIILGNCAGCHGSTANTTGNGYRFDFYDMTPEVCGAAASALPAGIPLAHAWAPSIAMDVTPPASGGRERMPPIPADTLLDWQRETVQRWAMNPIKGTPPSNNHPPTIQIFGLQSQVSNQLSFTAVVSDPDGDEAVGVINFAGMTFAMDRSGSFVADIDVANVPAATYRLSGVACDGWTNTTVDLGPLTISH